MFKERAIVFDCKGDRLVGIVSEPQSGASIGLLIVVGGPQYRIGSHRQFVLLARQAAAARIPTMRFDYRGMGDSDGDKRSFEDIGDDIRAAVDAFISQVPDLRHVVIWGLCDAASASLFYAPSDERVTGLVLLNPWVRTEQGVAKSYLRHYYLNRLMQPAFWWKVVRGEFGVIKSARSLLANIVAAIYRTSVAAEKQHVSPHSFADSHKARAVAVTLPDRVTEGFKQFGGRILLILAGNDLTAAEFSDTLLRTRPWRNGLRRGKIERRDLPLANHTFASREWRDQVAQWTIDWISSCKNAS